MLRDYGELGMVSNLFVCTRGDGGPALKVNWLRAGLCGLALVAHISHASDDIESFAREKNIVERILVKTRWGVTNPPAEE